MKHYEAPESVKYHGGYDPSDPPQGEHWCSECSNWDDECECCPHDEHNHGICLDCGKDIHDDLVGRAEMLEDR